jgi:alkanesulfonate monooxygenase SsuD/methylene tetrahydromethanopterin reductase-like flavin-dependent oxidoreductase (luciferase family)
MLIGGNGKRMLELTARYADSWNTWGRNSLESIRARQHDLDVACAATGRDPADIERTAAVMVDVPGVDGSSTAAWVTGLRARREPAVTGSTAELADFLCRLADDGIAHVQLWIEPNTVAGIETFAPVLDLLDRG